MAELSQVRLGQSRQSSRAPGTTSDNYFRVAAGGKRSRRTGLASDRSSPWGLSQEHVDEFWLGCDPPSMSCDIVNKPKRPRRRGYGRNGREGEAEKSRNAALPWPVCPDAATQRESCRLRHSLEGVYTETGFESWCSPLPWRALLKSSPRQSSDSGWQRYSTVASICCYRRSALWCLIGCADPVSPRRCHGDR